MDWWLDVRYALRALRRSPGFVTIAAVTLALGIGANTSIFSVVHAVLLRPPEAVEAPDRVVYVFTSDYSGPAFGSSSYPDVQAFRAATDVFEAMAAFTPSGMTLAAGASSEAERLRAELVDGPYFEAFGVRADGGRLLREADGAPGSAPVAVLSADLWRTRFAADPSIIGAIVRIDDVPYTVVGVAADGFRGAARAFPTQLWVPLRTAAGGATESLERRDARGLGVVARLRGDAGVQQAQARMAALASALRAEHPESWTDISGAGRRITVVSERDARVPPASRGAFEGFAVLLMAVVGLVLLLCCANVANLLLARATARRREIAVRIAIGAGSGRLLRQLFAESLLLALLGAVGGAILAAWVTDLLPRFVPAGMSLTFTPDGTVLGYTLAAAFACALLFGLAPALQSIRSDVSRALRGEEAGAATTRRIGLRDALVVVQMAISIVLLIGAGLFLRSLQEAGRIDPGFDAEGVLLMRYAQPGADVGDERRRLFEERLRERVAALPGVTGVTFAQRVPIAQPFGRRSVEVDGYQPAPGEEMEFPLNIVGPEYFEVLRVPLVRGRTFTETDRAGAAPVIIVNETFARRFWPGQEPIGRTVTVGADAHAVVGVARDGKYWSLSEEPRPYYYLPRLQQSVAPTLHVRVDGDPERLAADVRAVARDIEPGLVAIEIRTMDAALADALLPQRAASTLLGLFGALALALASTGLYGVMAYAVGRRMPEFGLRIALGARPADVLRLVLGRALGLAAAGLAIGLVLAAVAARLTRSFLFAVSPTDARTFALTAVVLVAVALFASWLPAWRATRSDPMRALRTE